MAFYKVYGLNTAPAVDEWLGPFTETQVYTVPAGVNKIEAFCIGGGGGGSCGEAWNVLNDRISPDEEWEEIYTQFRVGGAGGGGGHLATRTFDVVEGQQLTISIGSGGSGGTHEYENPSDTASIRSIGGSGGSTSFGSSSAGYVTAQGGSGGRMSRSSTVRDAVQDFIVVGGNGGSGGAPGALSYWYDSSLSNDRWTSTYSHDGYDGGSNGSSTGGALPTDTPINDYPSAEYVRRYLQVKGTGDGVNTYLNGVRYAAGGGGGNTVTGRERIGSTGNFDFYYNSPGVGGNYGGGKGGGTNQDPGGNYLHADISAIPGTASGGGGCWLRYAMTNTGNYWESPLGGDGSAGVVILHIYHT